MEAPGVGLGPRRLLVLLWAVLAAAVVAGCSLNRGAAPAPAFELRNQFGQLTNLADHRGQTVLLTFLYTHCPDTCPLYLSNITASRSELARRGEDLPAVVVVTVDPDRDTVERLQEYAGNWPSDWLFLTGTYQQVARVWQDYGIRVDKRPGAHSTEVHEGYSVVHDAKLVVVDRDGSVGRELTGNWRAPELIAALRAGPSQPALAPSELLVGLDALLRRCGELATSQPAIFFGLVALAMLPGLALPVYLLRLFVRDNSGCR